MPEMKMVTAAVAVVAAMLAACNPCSDEAIEVRAFEGDDVEGTIVTCTGDKASHHHLCTNQPAETLIRDGSECLDGRLGVYGASLGVSAVIFDFSWDGDRMTAASAHHQSSCDDDCGINTRSPRAGWIMPQESTADLSGRQHGRFHLEFDGWAMTGQYDTVLSTAADAGPP